MQQRDTLLQADRDGKEFIIQLLGPLKVTYNDASCIDFFLVAAQQGVIAVGFWVVRCVAVQVWLTVEL